MRSRFHALGLGLLLAVGAVGVSVPAIAQSQPKDAESTFPACAKQPTDAQSEEAHRRYLLGKDAYDSSDWDVALRYFSDAYRSDCTKHELLVIISRAHEQRRELKEAIDTLKLYLKRASNVAASDKDTYERRIRKLEGELAKAPPTTTAPTTTAPTSTAPTTTNVVAPPPPPESHHSAFPFILGGVGAAAVIAGVVIYLTAPKTPDGCNTDTEVCTSPDQLKPLSSPQLDSNKEKAGLHKTQTIAGGAVIAGGALMLVGGVIWFLVEPTTSSKSSSTKLRFAPELSPSYGGFSLTKSF